MTHFNRLNANDAKALIEQGNSQIIDIRDAMSFTAGHISSATHIDNDNLNQFMATAKQEAPLIVCCYHGNASQGAAEFFTTQGFQEVYSLDGGYEQWKVMYPDACEA